MARTTPKQTRTVINALQAAFVAAQEELKSYPQEEPIQIPPSDFRGKVWFYLDEAIQEGKKKAMSCKDNDPSTHMYIHHAPFPQDLYDGLMSDNSGFMKSLENIGFAFYMTHNGVPHPMVKFTYHF